MELATYTSNCHMRMCESAIIEVKRIRESREGKVIKSDWEFQGWIVIELALEPFCSCSEGKYISLGTAGAYD